MKQMSLFRLGLVFFLSLVAYFGCQKGQSSPQIDLSDRLSETELRQLTINKKSESFRFGFDLRHSPLEDARQYVPLLNYLEKTTGYPFELCFMTQDGQIITDLGQGRVHFAAIGAGSFLKAYAKYKVIPLVRGLNEADQAIYQSVIFVAPDSLITKIEDLRHKRFAFGSHTSTQGHLIPRIVLAQHGLELNDLAAYEYTGSHRHCAEAVLSGRFEAGGMQDTLGRELGRQGLIRIIHTSGYYPSSGLAASPDVSPGVIFKVQQALLSFQPNGKDAVGLYNWEKTEMPNGFIEAKVEDYKELLEWAQHFGLLTESPQVTRP